MVNVANVAEEDDDRGENDEGDQRCVVQDAIEGAGFFAVAHIVGGGGISGHDIALRREAGENHAVGA